MRNSDVNWGGIIIAIIILPTIVYLILISKLYFNLIKKDTDEWNKNL